MTTTYKRRLAEARAHPTRRAIEAAFLISIFLLQGGCAKIPGFGTDDSIVIDREVFVHGVGGTPNAMARLKNGNFIIAGNSSVVAWAVAIDADGNTLWTYQEPQDPQLRPINQSAFHGVVALPNGKSLFCGEMRDNDHSAGIAFIVLLDSKGSVLEHRKVYPNDFVHTRLSRFTACVPWAGGADLVGIQTKEGVEVTRWILRLDQEGKRLWETTAADLPQKELLEIPDGGFFGILNSNGIEPITLTRFDSAGHLMAKRKVTAYDGHLVQGSAGSPDVLKIIITDGTYRNFLMTVNGDLKDIHSPERISPVFVQDGIAMGLADGSVALFGQESAGSAFRSAIGWVHRSDGSDLTHETDVPTPQTGSFSYRDALALSSNQFLTVRDHVDVKRDSTEFFLTWATFH